MLCAGASYFLDMSGVEEEEEDLVCDTDEDSNKDSENEIASAVAPPEPPRDPSDDADREAIIEEVPEYAEDIYSYLLTVEVTKSFCSLHAMHFLVRGLR